MLTVRKGTATIKRSCRKTKEGGRKILQRPSGVERRDADQRIVRPNLVLVDAPPTTPFPAKQYKHNGRRGTVAGQGLIGWVVASLKGELCVSIHIHVDLHVGLPSPFPLHFLPLATLAVSEDL